MLQNSTMNRYSRSQQANCKIIYILVLVFMAIAAGAVALVTEKDVTELRAALKQNQKKIRNCQQQARREAVALRKGGLSCHAVRRVLAVYLVSNWDLKLAMLAAQRLSRLPPCSAAFSTPDFVRALFVEHKWEDFLLVHDDASPLWAPARKFASQFLLEHDAWCWVKRQNFCQEVAPSASDVFHYYENKVLDAVPSGEPRRRTVNKWATRWRARWDVRRASLRSADAVDANILREKAGNGQKIGSQFLDRCPASKIGPLQIGGLLFRPESGPLFRPQKPSTESVFVAISFNVFQTHGNFFCVAR